MLEQDAYLELIEQLDICKEVAEADSTQLRLVAILSPAQII